MLESGGPALRSRLCMACVNGVALSAHSEPPSPRLWMRVAYGAEVRGAAAWMMLGVLFLLLLLQLLSVLFLLTLLVFLLTPLFSSSTGAGASDLSMQSRLCQFI